MVCISRIQRATLTSLCLYSNRQATIWVDMIAEDLFAAGRDIKVRIRYSNLLLC